MSRTIPFSQYETNLWSTHVNIVRLAEPIRHCVRWRTQVFKIEGFVRKRFLPSLPSPPTFIFLALVSFLAQPKSRIPFLGLSLLRNQTETLAMQANLTTEHTFFWWGYIGSLRIARDQQASKARVHVKGSSVRYECISTNSEINFVQLLSLTC